MIGKFLKRNISRNAMTDSNTKTTVNPVNGVRPSPALTASGSDTLPLQYRYQRPDVLGQYSADALSRFADHQKRVVVVPSDEGAALPDGVGYAEVINAGKSRYNEDQAAVHTASIIHQDRELKYIYLALFDGHGGPGVAVKAMKEMRHMIHEGLEDVAAHIFRTIDQDAQHSAEHVQPPNNELEDGDTESCLKFDELICGALESAFWAMDRLILRDKQSFRISGGACVLIALALNGKLFVANAGDSRAAVYLSKQPRLMQMSTDFSPEADRQRIQLVAYQRPELLRHPVTKEKLFNRHILSRKLVDQDLGTTVLYQDFYMSGWSCRDVTADDVKLLPIIDGRGKQCRLLSTMGVARGIGDHDLTVRACAISCKEFLTCQPEIKIFMLDQIGSSTDMLVMGTDGYWDVISNQETRDLLHQLCHGAKHQVHPCVVAKSLVEAARGHHKDSDQFWVKADGQLASGDDITILVANLSKIASAI